MDRPEGGGRRGEHLPDAPSSPSPREEEGSGVRLLVGKFAPAATALLLLGTVAYLTHVQRAVSDAVAPLSQTLRVAAADSGGSSSRGHVVLVFQPEDCPRSLAAIRRLNRLAAARERSVGGLVVGMEHGSEELDVLARTYDIRFALRPMSAESAGRILHVLGYGRTPVVLGLGPDGRLLWVHPGDSVPDELGRDRASTPS